MLFLFENGVSPVHVVDVELGTALVSGEDFGVRRIHDALKFVDENLVTVRAREFDLSLATFKRRRIKRAKSDFAMELENLDIRPHLDLREFVMGRAQTGPDAFEVVDGVTQAADFVLIGDEVYPGAFHLANVFVIGNDHARPVGGDE